MKFWKRAAAAAVSMTLLCSCVVVPGTVVQAATENIESSYDWGTLKIGGGGFVSGIVTGQKEMYLRTDVGGAYKYNYETKQWDQLFGFLTDADRGLLSCKGIAIDPTDDDTVYFLCGCAYFSDARTVIFKTTDGGKTFTEADVTEHIQVHGNGDGRECIEPIAVDPDDPDIIYAGGDVTAGKSALIKSTDGGATWSPVEGYDALELFSGELKYPMWTDNMVRGTEPTKEYNQQNGIGCILIEGGKVYVGTSVTGQTNIHVADVDTDEFTALSADLPTANYPLSITSDHHGSLFFTYIAGLAFAGTSGGAYKYDTASGKITELPIKNSSGGINAIGMIEADEDDPNKLLARTCGVWADQWYGEEWVDDDPSTPENEGTVAWGDHFYRSTDGGATWQDITPGAGETIYDQDGGSHKEFVSLPMEMNGYDWIYGKACHWGSGILLDPRDPDRILLTSGNGVFACDNVWDESGVQFYFQPDGVEEVVSLDGVSVPGGAFYSAIGDYDGFIHENPYDIPPQYTPNMGSTSAIAYCPSDPDVMARISENDATGYYSMDGGKSWTGMQFDGSSGKLSITEVEDGVYRIFHSGSSGAVSYTDDFGGTWSNSTGISGTKATYTLVDPTDPSVVYGSGINYNDYWASTPGKTEPTLDESHYAFYISTDYGETFTQTQMFRYDMCDHTGDLAYVAEDTLAMAGGWEGLYLVTDAGETLTKLDVNYAKCVGYGAPEKAGDPNTLFIYGKIAADDAEGIYRSQDAGETWTLINTQHIYGGTGNGNYIVGDMNEFGKMYMSTVGCGIVWGAPSGSTPKPDKPVEPTETEKPDVPTETGTPDVPGDVVYGDANENGKVELADVVALNRYLLNIPDSELSEQAMKNVDVDLDDVVGPMDALYILEHVIKLIDKLPV